MYPLIVPVAVAAVLLTTPATAQLAASPIDRSNYESAFRDYRPFKNPSLAPWRGINDLAARIGGHGGALESGATQQSPALTEKPPSGAAAGTPAAHPQHP